MVVTVIQARRGSSRLPDKILLPLAGAPLLVRMIERVLRARQTGQVVVATTTDSHDDVVEDLCRERGWPVYRGHPTDLLDRHYQTALKWGADAVVKIPSDCPLIDAGVIDRVISKYLEGTEKWDYVSNLHPATYPDGHDVEIMSMQALTEAWQQAAKPFEREHTTPYLWERPERFRIANVDWETGLDYSMSHRWTIDYQADYHFIAAIYETLYPQNPAFGLADILRLLEEKPEIAALNAQYAGVNWYRHHLDELQTIAAHQTRNLES